MQSEPPPEQGPSVKQERESTTPPRTKRRRQSEHSPRTTTEEPETSTLPSGSETDRTLRGSPQKRGSSRERDMQRSSTPPESSASTIRYTRTGRVSKASKGQRVHSCDECGKVCPHQCAADVLPLHAQIARNATSRGRPVSHLCRHTESDDATAPNNSSYHSCAFMNDHRHTLTYFCQTYTRAEHLR